MSRKIPDFFTQYLEAYIKKAAKSKFPNQALGINSGDYQSISVMAFFDKNIDGIVTKEEFESKSKEEYDSYLQSLFDYLNENPDKKSSLNQQEITSYDDIQNLLKQKNYFGILELTHKPDKSWPTSDEFVPEEKHKSGNINNENIEERMYLNTIDENSNTVDWHIGTHNQGTLNTCSLLSAIEMMDSDELHNLYTEMTDSEGNIYYKVDFPNDDGKKSVIITKQELKDGYITYKNQQITGFSSGDKDTTLIEMAYIKRYGTNILKKGESASVIMKRLYKDASPRTYTYKIPTEEMLTNGKRSTTKLTDVVFLINKYGKNKNNYDLTLPNGDVIEVQTIEQRNGVTYNFKLPNGQIIYDNHFYAITNYNQETKEVTLVNPHENSTDIKIPFEVYKYLFDITQ